MYLFPFMNVCVMLLSCGSRTLEEENGCLGGRDWWSGLLLLLGDLLLNLLILAILRWIHGHAAWVIVSGMEGRRAGGEEEIARHTLLATGVIHSTVRVWRWGRTGSLHWLRSDSIFWPGFLPPPNVVDREAIHRRR